jgi:signal transduction histidine kinase
MLLGCTIAAISVLIIILIKWTSSLGIEVKRRTRQLDESNKQLALANEQLTMHDKMQKEFINVAAHELKTPIQPIISLAEHLKSTRRQGSWGADMYGISGEAQLQKKQQQQDELIDVIIRNARRLRRLAENILDVTKIETQSLSIKKERFNLNNLILSIITDFRNQIAKENRDLKFEFISNGIFIANDTTDEIFVDADKDRISQVISNLLNNAIKSTKAGTITVVVNSIKMRTCEVGAASQEVIVTIKDTGSGVDPEILPRLFTKFATKSQSGTGLGLFISKNIIETHGGKIWLEDGNGKNNNGVNGNNGATFSFSLPMSNPKHLSSKLINET